MPLAAGTSLGPYEIAAPIGAGGMGEVYKARDMRLDRIVARSIDIGRAVSTRLTFEASSEVPAYSSDGSRVFFSQGGNVGQVPASGAGRPGIVATLNAHHKHASPDGKRVAFEAASTGVENATRRIWILPLDKEGRAYPLFNGPAEEVNPQFSPDGRWIAYESFETGRREVYMQSFPPGKGTCQVSRNSGVLPRWRRDGKKIYYLEPSCGR